MRINRCIIEVVHFRDCCWFLSIFISRTLRFEIETYSKINIFYSLLINHQQAYLLKNSLISDV